MIRSYEDDDLEAVLDSWYQASLVAHPFLDEDFLAGERKQIADRWLPVAETYVFEHDGDVVGFLALVANELGGLFVHPDHQGKGVGRALMNHARQTRSYLELSVFEANSIGRRFYDAYGFRVVGRDVHETTGLPELRMRFD